MTIKKGGARSFQGRIGGQGEARRPSRFWRRGARRIGGSAPSGEAGAAMVEFACALMFIFLIFTAYMKISEIFLAHSRLRYATFAASRVHAVHGSAQDAADAIDKDFTLKTSDSEVGMEKTVKLPKAVATLFGEDESFKINHKVKTFSEPSQSGDNKAK